MMNEIISDVIWFIMSGVYDMKLYPKNNNNNNTNCLYKMGSDLTSLKSICHLQ